MPRFVRSIRFTLLILAFALVGTGVARTQTPAAPVVAGQQKAIEALSKRADQLSDRVQGAAEDDAALVDLRLELEQLARDILHAGVSFRPRLSEINNRLEQLGGPPPDGAPAEPEIVATERQSLTAEKAEINALLGVAESASIRVNQQVGAIAVMRSDLFANTLSKRYDLNFVFGGEVIDELRGEASDLYRALSSWARFTLRFKLSSVFAATFMALLAAAVLLIGGKRLFGNLIVADPAAEDPSYLSRLSVAFWSTLLPSLAFTVFLGATHFFLDYFNILRADIRVILGSAFAMASVVYFIHRLARAVLSPGLPNWRLIEIGTRPARMLLWLLTATALVTGLDFFLSAVSEVLRSPLSLTVSKSLAATVLVGVLVVLIGLVKPFANEDGTQRAWPRPFRYTLFVLGAMTIAAALLGYIGLARFVSQQIVVTGAILATMYIGFLSAKAVSEEGAFSQTALGKRLNRRFTLDETTLDQFGLVTSIAINILILLWGLPLILFQWGFQWGDIQGWVYQALTGIKVGTITISLAGIFSGILVFVVGYFLTRGFQGWLDGTVMARGKVDAGVRNSIRTAVGYAGVAVAALVGLSAAGIDLSNLALVAGALSLGIGFGLQNVVSNFVSGLILLAERPFKAGDWIVAGAVSGTVRKISVRATEIETFQRQTVILPNSELINAAVGNWTHKNRLGRVEIPVGVAYGTDARKAHEILLDIARSHPLVLKNPEPFVLFSGFGDSSLDFEIRVFLSDILNGVIVQNDVRFAVLDRFAAEGIEIPFPQRDVTLKAGDGFALQPVAPAAPPARKSRRRPDPD